MTETCAMAETLTEVWRDFAMSTEQFRQITEGFAEAMEEGLEGNSSSLQMLPTYVHRPIGSESGTFLSLDFGGTNVRVAEVQLCRDGKTKINKLHKVSLKNNDEKHDYTGADVHVRDLFAFIARQLAWVADGQQRDLGHSFSYASRQTAIGRARFLDWSKEIKVSGLAGQDINELLSEELARQKIATVHPRAVLNDTTATLLAAAYTNREADLGSVCGTGHNTCYFESRPRHGHSTRPMAYNAEAGGFSRLLFSRFDEELDRDSESPGKQRMEKMVAGRYLGELTRRILWAGRGECALQDLTEFPVFSRPDGLSSVDVAVFAGDDTAELEKISNWFMDKLPARPVNLAECHFVKAVARMVIDRAAFLVAASYAGFLRHIDLRQQSRHVIGINGSLYEKMPGFAAGIQSALATHGGWSPMQVSFLSVNEAPLVGAAIAAAMAAAEEK